MQTPAAPLGEFYLGRRNTRSLGLIAATSMLSVSGVSWMEQTSSILGSASLGRDVTINHVPVKTVDTEVVAISDTAAKPPVEPTSDLAVAADFVNGPMAGSTQVALVATNVPIGAEVWFHNTTGSISISVPPSKVNTQPFAVTSIVDLEAGYAAKMCVYLRLNGTKLPSDWNLRFEAIHIDGMSPEAQLPKPVVTTNGGPKPGTLLGRITIS